MTRTLVTALIGCAVFATGARADDGGNKNKGTKPSHTNAGGWKRGGDDSTPSNQQWTADIKRGENGVITGRMSVAGHSHVRGANLKGTLVGMEVSGILIDDHGKQIGTFKGNITPTGAEGDFAENTGQTGSWTWQRPSH